MIMDNSTIAIIVLAVPSILGGLKVLAKLTKTDWDDKAIDAALKAFNILVPKKK